MLEIQDLSVSFGGVRAVDQVSFVVTPNSILGLIGPNGAGKTTVFDAICGFVQPDSGRVLLGEKDISKVPSAERARAGLGRSFQDGRLFPSLTVAECLATAMERHLPNVGVVSAALRVRGTRRSERDVKNRIDELIEMMSLQAFRDKFVSELSTGSRRIVDLACVLAHSPSVLLLDEPSSGIAQRETEALGPLLRNVKKATGCTMLLIEHDMPLVTSVSDELIAMDVGRLIARGTPAEVTMDPHVVESYLGTEKRIRVEGGPKPTARAARPRPRDSRKPRPKSTAARGKTRATRAKKGAKTSRG